MTDPTTELRILLHAPTAAALIRARGNAVNLAKDAPLAVVRIVVNGEAVAALLDAPDAASDPIALVCPNTLRKIGRSAPASLAVLAVGAVQALATMQREGWCYVRA